MRIIVGKGACRPSFETKMERRMRLVLFLFCAAVLRTCKSESLILSYSTQCIIFCMHSEPGRRRGTPLFLDDA